MIAKESEHFASRTGGFFLHAHNEVHYPYAVGANVDIVAHEDEGGIVACPFHAWG